MKNKLESRIETIQAEGRKLFKVPQADQPVAEAAYDAIATLAQAMKQINRASAELAEIARDFRDKAQLNDQVLFLSDINSSSHRVDELKEAFSAAANAQKLLAGYVKLAEKFASQDTQQILARAIEAAKILTK